MRGAGSGADKDSAVAGHHVERLDHDCRRGALVSSEVFESRLAGKDADEIDPRVVGYRLVGVEAVSHDGDLVRRELGQDRRQEGRRRLETTGARLGWPSAATEFMVYCPCTT